MHTKVQTDHFRFIIKSLIVGLVTGTVVSTFRFLIEKSVSGWQNVYQFAHTHLWILAIVLLVNILLALFIGYLSKKQPHIMGSGIPEVEGQLKGQLKLSWWPILWRKFVGGILAIGSGLFLGREGPSIQLGSSIGQGLGEKFEKSKPNQDIMIACGAAAGLAAAFNAPIASTLFVLEEIYHNFSTMIWMTALSASISSDFVAMQVFGLTPVLAVHPTAGFPLNSYWQLIILGIVLGLLGRLYQIVLLAMPAIYRRLVPRLPRAFQGLIPFILVIPIGFFWPQVLGGGNSTIIHMAKVHWGITLLIGLFLLRFIFSMISYGSGLPGGIFLPILTLGAIIGTAVGTVMCSLHLLPQSYIVDLLVFGMAGYFACIGKAPFTAILLITEMVGSLQHLMPLALTSLVAYVVVDLLGGAPIYESLLERMQLGQKIQSYSDNNERISVPVFNDSQLINQQVRDIRWPKNSLLISITRGEHKIVPRGDTNIQVGDTLTFSTNEKDRKIIKKLIK